MEEVQKRLVSERIKDYLNDKNNLMFILILIFALVVRLYYFFLTKSQPLWWDEADYMAYAKNLAGIDNGWIITEYHNSLLPYVAALFFKIGLSEPVIRFFIEFIPSFLLVFLAYKICTLMYKDKRIALISTFLIAIFWELLFNSYRFHVDNPALFFCFFGCLYFLERL